MKAPEGRVLQKISTRKWSSTSNVKGKLINSTFGHIRYPGLEPSWDTFSLQNAQSIPSLGNIGWFWCKIILVWAPWSVSNSIKDVLVLLVVLLQRCGLDRNRCLQAMESVHLLSRLYLLQRCIDLKVCMKTIFLSLISIPAQSLTWTKHKENRAAKIRFAKVPYRVASTFLRRSVKFLIYIYLVVLFAQNTKLNCMFRFLIDLTISFKYSYIRQLFTLNHKSRGLILCFSF